MTKREIIKEVSGYYSQKLKTHGTIPAGVDWNSELDQLIRFQQLSKVISTHHDEHFSIADLGCGYGQFYNYLKEFTEKFDYRGYDISQAMCNVARDRLKHCKNATVECNSEINQYVDYTISSGIFNVRMQTSANNWTKHIEDILDNMNYFSLKGFAFNCLTSYSDDAYKRDDLYYANPIELFARCKQMYSLNVALLHDYNLYDFTILVRK